MSRPFSKISATSVFFLLLIGSLSGQNFSAGINTETPNPNAVLHLVSPNGNQGLLIPQLSTTARTSMSLSATDNGLLVYDNEDGIFYYWLDPAWIPLSISDSQNLSLAGTTISIDNGNSIDLSTINTAETDPTVPNTIKDGIDWTEVSGIPADFSDNIDNVDDADNDPTNEIELPATATLNEVLTWNGTAWVASISPADGDSDATNEIELPATAGLNEVLTWNGTAWVAASSPADGDSDATNEIELPATATLNDVLFWDGSNWVAGALSDGDNDATNEIELPATATLNQVLIWNGSAWVAGTDAVDDADNDPANEIETWATLAGIPAGFADDTDDVDDADNDPGNEIELPATATNNQVLLYNGTAWVAGTDAVDDADNDPANEIETWATLAGIPAGFADDTDDVDDADNDPANEIETWATLAGIPAGFADDTDDVDDADNDPANEIETWATLAGIPAGFADDTDDGMTAVNVDNATILGDGAATALSVGTVPVANVSGLGTAALLDAGVGAGDLVQLPSASTLPALNGSNLTNITLGANSITSTMIGTGVIVSDDIANGTIVNIDVSASAAIDALKIGTGTVSNGELNFINGLNQNLATTDDVTFNAITTTDASIGDMNVTGNALFDGNIGLGNEATDVINVVGGLLFIESTEDLLLDVVDQSVVGGVVRIPDVQGNNYTVAFEENSVFNVIGSNYYSNGTSLPSLTSGVSNVLIGTNAGANVADASQNIVLGESAGEGLIGGNGNVLIGLDAGVATTTSNNVFIGHQAGFNHIDGLENVVIGSNADASNVADPFRGVAIGASALVEGNRAVTIGFQSIATGVNSNTIGYNSHSVSVNSVAIGSGNTSQGDNSISLGTNNQASGNYSVAVGTDVQVAQGNTIALGDGDGTNDTYRVGINTSTPTEELEVNGDVLIRGNFITPPDPAILNVSLATIAAPTERILKVNALLTVSRINDSQAVEGQEVILVNVGLGFSLTDGLTGGGGLLLDNGNDYFMNPGSTLHLVYIVNPIGDGDNYWVEIGRSAR